MTRQPPSPAPEPRPTSRQMLATYLGLHEQPPLRPDWQRHALWVVPAALTLAVYVLISVSGIVHVLIWLVLIALFAVITFMSAVRVQYVRLLDKQTLQRRRNPPADPDAS